MHSLRREAWQFGRELRDGLLADYARAYGEPGRPPALIGGELLTDFLGARLAYDALPLDVFAQTSWEDYRALVTVNSRMREIAGVKDAEGVAHVAVWHEIMHVQRDLPALRRGPQTAFAGMRPSAPIACSRDPRAGGLRGEELRLEVFAGGGRPRRGRLLAPSPAGRRLPGLPGPRHPRPRLRDGGLAPALPSG